MALRRYTTPNSLLSEYPEPLGSVNGVRKLTHTVVGSTEEWVTEARKDRRKRRKKAEEKRKRKQANGKGKVRRQLLSRVWDRCMLATNSSLPAVRPVYTEAIEQTCCTGAGV